jgi:hypothetical protein
LESKLPSLNLKYPLVFHTDGSLESVEARCILEDAGIMPISSEFEIEIVRPAVCFAGGIYQGTAEIKSLIDWLFYCARQGSGPPLFAA